MDIYGKYLLSSFKQLHNSKVKEVTYLKGLFIRRKLYSMFNVYEYLGKNSKD